MSETARASVVNYAILGLPEDLRRIGAGCVSASRLGRRALTRAADLGQRVSDQVSTAGWNLCGNTVSRRKWAGCECPRTR
jgi:hypothetical protein